MRGDKCVGAVVAKLEHHRGRVGHYRGYVAMLAVHPNERGRGLGRALVQRCIDEMKVYGGVDCYLETEVTNTAALKLYQSLGFIRDKRMKCYYLNGNDAWRLLLTF